ncbi:hypothetical protein H8356DRAFT_1427880 [Neocallimastix lanati (nom. inval.)]|nr:hypothetical protein H8356DRAFT_1427880 [Neocallimastix sp. JGI-2020a]
MKSCTPMLVIPSTCATPSHSVLQIDPNIFADRTFYVVPKFNYHVFITGNYVPELNRFYNKDQATFEVLFK